MKRILLFIILGIFLLSSIIPTNAVLAGTYPPSKSSNQYKEGFRFNIQGWVYVHVQGDAYERGFQHGYLLSAEIVDMLNRWSNIIHNYPIIKRISSHQSDANFEKMSTTWWNFCVKQCYRLYWDKFPDEYQQEIKGIADGVVAQGGTLHGRSVNYQDILTMNEMYEFLSKLTKIPKGIHPLRTLFQQLQPVVPEITHVNVSTLIETFLQQSPAHHCNGFVASGNATSQGQLVFAQTTICGGSMWWWTYYISLRWNVLLDIQPRNGHRIIMPTSPGLIWSDEDYYQNDNGLVLLETTVPQGPFDNKGLPLSVRARNAMQYGENIDDMLYSLRYRNDGAMNAVWLLGDSKTGEIARLDLGYRHSAVWRTFNGFYWSANIPLDISVRFERINIKDFLVNIFLQIVGSGGSGYYSIRYIPEDRDLKFEELGNKYYGHIDIEILKQIMQTSPISDYITDIKATDSYLLKQNGLWAFFGNPYRSLYIADVSNQVVTTQEVPPAGWVRVFGIPSKQGFSLAIQKKESPIENTTVLWKFDTKDTFNNFTSASAVENDRLYVTTSSGILFCLNTISGSLRWQVFVGSNPTAPVVSNGMVFVGDKEGLSKYSKTGERLWKILTDGHIISRPIIIENNVYCADSYGNIFDLAMTNGLEQWRLNTSNASYLSTTYDQNIYVTSGNSCIAVNRNNGTILWIFSTHGPITSAPTYSNNTVYLNSWDTKVYALDAKTGKEKWIYQTGWGFDTPPTVSNQIVIIASMDNNLYALTEKGVLKWMFSCQAGIHSTSYTYGNFVFIGSDDGRVYAVNESTGAAEWVFAPRYIINGIMNYATTPILSNPIVANGAIVVGANGTIYGLNAQTVEVPDRFVPTQVQSVFPEIPIFWYIWFIIIFVIILIMLYIRLKKKN
jgi:outer membrane protein assembly factor BamB